MKYRTQKRLVTGLTALLTSALGRFFANRIFKEAPPPEQRTLADDTKEAISYEYRCQRTLLALLAPRRLTNFEKSHARLNPTQLCQEILLRRTLVYAENEFPESGEVLVTNDISDIDDMLLAIFMRRVDELG